MKRSAVCGFLVPLLLIASSAAGQSASIHQQIQQTYNFQPHLLSNQQITEKSAALDRRAAVYSYGEIDFPTFYNFLIGNTGPSQSPGGDSSSGFAHLGTGLHDRDTVAADYHLFVQDGWKIFVKTHPQSWLAI